MKITNPCGETLEKPGSPSPEFWDWLPRAYRYEGNGVFTKYNMEVAWLAGKQSVQKESKMKANTYKVLARCVEEGVAWGWNRAHKYGDNPTPEALQNHIVEAVLNEVCEWMDFGEAEGE